MLEDFAPLSYQESYDNAGLLVGDPRAETTGVLLCVDATEAVVSEAEALGANLIVSHHPLIFGGLKRLTGRTATERTVAEAIKKGIAVYACHTNLDAVAGGVSFRMAEKLGLERVRVLSPLEKDLLKLAVYVPEAQADRVRNALFEAGAGHIGNYDRCSYNVHGEGTFRAGEGAHPFAGEVGRTHVEREVRIETVVPRPKAPRAVAALKQAHPYEEAAYDLYPLENPNPLAGFGAVGELPAEEDTNAFLKRAKQVFGIPCLRCTPPVRETVRRIAVCGGSGVFLLEEAVRAGADVLLTADAKYHDFFRPDGRIVLADTGHFESERFTIDIFYELLTKKNHNFAVHKSKCCTNPVIYL